MNSEPNISLACFLLAAAATPALAEWPEARIMPLGDSITRGTNDINHPNGSIPGGYRKGLGESLANAALGFDFVGEKTDNAAPDMDPDHNGNNGYRTDEILANLPTWLERNPEIVLLKAGTNDILQDVPVATAISNLGSLIQAITSEAPNRYLYVSTILPITQNWNGKTAAYLNGNANAYNAQARDLVAQSAAQGLKVKLVEMNGSIVLTPVPGDPSQNFFQTGDGIHPGQAGYNQMGQIWFNSITGEDSYFVTPPPGAPGAPGSLSTATLSGSRIRLNWVDDSVDESGFKIERKSGTGGSFSQIATVPEGATSYDDPDLGNGTEYIYRVRSVNGISNSPYSNEAGAITSDTVDYDMWALRYPAFSSLEEDDRLPMADPNRDGVNNLLCYALNLDPTGNVALSDIQGIEWMAAEPEGELLPWFHYRRSKTAAASLSVEGCPESIDAPWEELSQEGAIIEEIPGDDLTDRVRVPLEGGNRFARLKVIED